MREPVEPRPGIAHRRIAAAEVTLHIAEAGQGPPVLLLHGMPELWYSWRHQLPALADAGFHAIAPDLRGLGRSDAPSGVEAYSMRHLVSDVLAVLDAIEAERAVLVGHDWGAHIVWQTAARHPDRIVAVAALSVPYYPRAASAPTDMMPHVVDFFQDALATPAGCGRDELRHALYRLLYTLSGEAPQDLLPALFSGPNRGADARVLRRIEPPPTPLCWLTETDLDYYVGEFARTGFEGVLNRYRNMVRDWEDSADISHAVITPPTLFIGGERDTAVVFGSLEPMQAGVRALRGMLLLPGCGHWVQQERPVEVNEALVAFVRHELAIA